MTTSENPAFALNNLVPTRLEEVFRANREMGQLGLATDEEIAALAGPIARSDPRHTLERWVIIAIRAKFGGQSATSCRLFGRLASGRSWITSNITRLDLPAGRVQTENSLYAVSGPSAGEAELDYPFLCAALNEWGIGQYFGVVEFFF